jgi:membrane-associated phospholipid phosphatase
MDTLIGWLANYLIWVMVAGAAVLWLLESRAVKLTSAATAVVGLLITLVLLMVAAHLHNDPRPFVVNRSLHPLIAHSADNGFPSDHSAAAGLLALLVWRQRRRIGLLFAVAAVGVAAARVAAHVHHVQDVVAGLVLGAAAAWLAAVAVGYVQRRITARRAERSSGQAATDGSGSAGLSNTR